MKLLENYFNDYPQFFLTKNQVKMKDCNYSIGQLIYHKNFNYRGVIYDIDPFFQGSEDWYKTMAITNPPKDEPWYYVLAHNAKYTTYVAQRNLIPDKTNEPIIHPLINNYFIKFENGTYISQIH